MPSDDDPSEAERAWFAAARAGAVEDLADLIAWGRDVDAKDRYGWTAAITAAANGGAAALRLLIEAGADLEARDGRGQTAATFAKMARHAQCAELIASELERRALATATAAAGPGHAPKVRL